MKLVNMGLMALGGIAPIDTVFGRNCRVMQSDCGQHVRKFVFLREFFTRGAPNTKNYS